MIENFRNHLRSAVPLVVFFLHICQVCGSVCISALPSGSDPVKSLSETVNSSAVSFSYNYKAVKGKTEMVGKGSAVVQGNAYMIDVDGLKFLCDGVSKWTADYSSKEVVIESADEEIADYCSNPVLLISAADKMFERVSSENISFNGRQVLAINLKPKSECGLEAVSLYFGDSLLVGAYAKSDDGTETMLSIEEFRTMEKNDLSSFVFDDRSLDSSWIITDLR